MKITYFIERSIIVTLSVMMIAISIIATSGMALFIEKIAGSSNKAGTSYLRGRMECMGVFLILLIRLEMSVTTKAMRRVVIFMPEIS